MSKHEEIVGVYVSDRSRDSAQGLWDSLPAVYRRCAVSYTISGLLTTEFFPKRTTSERWQGQWQNQLY